MKKIEAIIRKTKFEDVKEALLEADIEWFSYYDVRGVGKMRQTHIYRGVVYNTSSIERILLNIVVREKFRTYYRGNQKSFMDRRDWRWAYIYYSC